MLYRHSLYASLMTTATAQINNTAVSVNLQDILPSLLRMNNSRELYSFNSQPLLCPTKHTPGMPMLLAATTILLLDMPMLLTI
jgi:hypothetical protein